jgi:hypothetical protein
MIIRSNRPLLLTSLVCLLCVGSSTAARQILITKVLAGSPAEGIAEGIIEGIIEKGDVILGVGSLPHDTRANFLRGS